MWYILQVKLQAKGQSLSCAAQAHLQTLAQTPLPFTAGGLRDTRLQTHGECSSPRWARGPRCKDYAHDGLDVAADSRRLHSIR